MKMQTLLLALLLSSPATQAASPRVIPDIPPDADSSMYRSLTAFSSLLSAGDGLDTVVQLGERNLEWLRYINSFRPANDKLSLTSKDTQRGIPIDKPNEYNVPLVNQKLAELRPQMPSEMQQVIFENAAFTREPPVPLVDYLNWSRELDRVYQSALRWRTMLPYLGYLAERRHNDLRGWYFLSRLEGRAETLKNFAEQSEELKAKLRTWLIGLCFNHDYDDDIGRCASTVDEWIRNRGDLEAYYQSKAAGAQEMYEDYFTIPAGASRPEVRWQDGAQPRLVAPFLDPGKEEVRAFLRDNIEDEWRFGNWRLELPFQSSGSIPYVVFVPGATPHVNRLGGNEITMNALQPLTEYDAQWVIRHEYGHVLGLPDCYVEFYEPERRVIVNYQFDIDNLMCSRRGHIQERHVNELKRVYR